MLTMRIDGFVHALVHQELVGKGRKDEALYFNFDLRMSHYTDRKTYNQSRGLHLLYQVDPGYSYINVFSGVTNSPFAKIGEVEQWKHECTHDTCWRDIQIFSIVYFDMARQINEDLENDGLTHVAPKDMHEHHGFHVFGKNAFEWKKVLITKDQNDSSSYRKLVKLV